MRRKSSRVQLAGLLPRPKPATKRASSRQFWRSAKEVARTATRISARRTKRGFSKEAPLRRGFVFLDRQYASKSEVAWTRRAHRCPLRNAGQRLRRGRREARGISRESRRLRRLPYGRKEGRGSLRGRPRAQDAL